MMEPVSSWLDFKRILANEKLLPDVFLGSIEERLKESIHQSPIALYPYEPLLVEQHIDDAARLLERCLTYRREARELEIQSVKSAMDHKRFKATASIDQELELARLRHEQLKIARGGQEEAVREFSSGHQLAHGFKAIAGGRVKELVKDEELARREQELIEARWRIEHEYQDRYWQRHNEPGNAHNYGERQLRVVQLLTEDFAEAHAKATAAAEGISRIYGQQRPLPDLDNTNSALDSMVSWTRAAVRFIEAEEQFEVSYDLVVPLTQPWRTSGVPIISPENFQAALDSARSSNGPLEIVFQLPNVFPGLTNPRLRGIGLSYGNTALVLREAAADVYSAFDAYVRLRAVVRTPEQRAATGVGYFRPALLLGSVSLFGGSSNVAFVEGPACHNLDPVGEWKISVEPHGVYKSSEGYSLYDGVESNPITDLKLHLRVTGKPV